MKKTLLLVVMTGFFASSYGQFIDKGAVIANGSFSFYSTKFKESENKYSGFEIMPWAGYFVIDNLAVGAMLEYDHQTSENDASDSEQTNKSFLFGPVARYYLNNGIFFHGDFGFGKNKSESKSGGSTFESEYDITQFRIGVGYAIRITESVFFDPIIGYKSSKEKYDSADDTETGIFAMGSFTIKLK